VFRLFLLSELLSCPLGWVAATIHRHPERALSLIRGSAQNDAKQKSRGRSGRGMGEDQDLGRFKGTERVGGFLARRSFGGGALLALLLLGLPAVAGGREKPLGQLQIKGKAVTVDSTFVTIQDSSGQIVTVVCKEDFTLKVAVGSEVTAWYTPKEGFNYLDWLQYPPENFFVPAEQIRRHIKKIVVLPNYGVPDSKVLVDRIAGYVESNLGWYVAPAMLAEEIRKRSARTSSALDAIDPASGQFDMKAYLDSQRRLIARLASETRVNAVLEVTVERVQAKFWNQIAVWDGVMEPVAGKAALFAGHMTPFSINGNVPAATVEMKLWDSHGKLLWSNRRGFAVLYVRTGVGNNFRERPLTEVYQNEAGVNDWLAAALGTLAFSKTAAAAVPVN
jgi:hypothetical protein